MTSEALLIDRRNEARWYPMRVTYRQGGAGGCEKKLCLFENFNLIIMKKLLFICVLILSALTVSAQTTNLNEERTAELRQNLNIDYSMPDFNTSKLDPDIIGSRLSKILTVLVKNPSDQMHKSLLSAIVCEQKDLAFVTVNDYKVKTISKQDDTISVMLGIILEPNAKKLKKTDINLTQVKGIPESPKAIDLFSYLSRYIRE